jgi:hypothetical protein
MTLNPDPAAVSPRVGFELSQECQSLIFFSLTFSVIEDCSITYLRYTIFSNCNGRSDPGTHWRTMLSWFLLTRKSLFSKCNRKAQKLRFGLPGISDMSVNKGDFSAYLWGKGKFEIEISVLSVPVPHMLGQGGRASRRWLSHERAWHSHARDLRESSFCPVRLWWEAGSLGAEGWLSV